jgi:transposase
VGSGHSYADASKNPRELELERENAELRRANEILKDALGFFAKDRKR